MISCGMQEERRGRPHSFSKAIEMLQRVTS
jgi:hypothetical protein